MNILYFYQKKFSVSVSGAESLFIRCKKFLSILFLSQKLNVLIILFLCQKQNV